MPKARTREFLMRRIDRCYLIATWTRVAAKRTTHLELARHYRRLLASMAVRAPLPALA